jgi:HSP20 family molecular chaperone IbpA
MFALMPWTRRNSMLPRAESPFARIPREFGSLVDRLFANLPTLETPEWPSGWGLTSDETEKEFVLRFELPGFEPAEVKVEMLGEQLTVEAEHAEPAVKEPVAKNEVRTERARVRRVLTLPPGIVMDNAEATYRNGMLEVHIPRAPEAVGRRIEVKT